MKFNTTSEATQQSWPHTLLLEYADAVQVGCCSTCPSSLLLFSNEAWKSFMASFPFLCIPALQQGYLARIFVYYGPLFLLLSFLPCSLHIHSLASAWRTQTPWCKEWPKHTCCCQAKAGGCCLAPHCCLLPPFLPWQWLPLLDGLV